DRCGAARLWAAADRIRREARYSMLLADRRRVMAETAPARDSGRSDAWDAAWDEGAGWSLEAAIVEAKAALRGRSEGIETHAGGKLAVSDRRHVPDRRTRVERARPGRRHIRWIVIRPRAACLGRRHRRE